MKELVPPDLDYIAINDRACPKCAAAPHFHCRFTEKERERAWIGGVHEERLVLLPKAGVQNELDIPPLSFWRHAEGEVVVIIDVELEGFKDGNAWADLVRYRPIAGAHRGKKCTRTRHDFLDRFERLPDPVFPEKT